MLLFPLALAFIPVRSCDEHDEVNVVRDATDEEQTARVAIVEEYDIDGLQRKFNYLFNDNFAIQDSKSVKTVLDPFNNICDRIKRTMHKHACETTEVYEFANEETDNACDQVIATLSNVLTWNEMHVPTCDDPKDKISQQAVGNRNKLLLIKSRMQKVCASKDKNVKLNLEFLQESFNALVTETFAAGDKKFADSVLTPFNNVCERMQKTMHKYECDTTTAYKFPAENGATSCDKLLITLSNVMTWNKKHVPTCEDPKDKISKQSVFQIKKLGTIESRLQKVCGIRFRKLENV